MSGAFGGQKPPAPAPGIPQQPAPMFSNPMFNSQSSGFNNPMYGQPQNYGAQPSSSLQMPGGYSFGNLMGGSAQYGLGMTNEMPGNVMNGNPQGGLQAGPGGVSQQGAK